MFQTKEKKQILANWLCKVANADNNITQDEMQVISNIGHSLGMEDVKYREVSEIELDVFETTFLLRELYRLAASDKDFSQVERDVINDFIKLYKIDSAIVSATENWVNNYLANEKKYFDAVDEFLDDCEI